jgi:AraC-like DNA-binding protein
MEADKFYCIQIFTRTKDWEIKELRSAPGVPASSNWAEGAPGSQARAFPWPAAVTRATKTPSITVLRFSAEAMSGENQLAILREAFGRGLVRVEFEALSTDRFSFAATLRILPGLSIISGSCSGAVARRTRALISDGDDSLVFGIAVDGVGFASRFGREQMLSPGEGVLLSCADEGALVFPRQARFIGVRLPRQALRALTPDLEAVLLRPIPKDVKALRLLKEYLAALDDAGALLNSESSLEVGRIFATQVKDLMALALDATRDGAELAKGRGAPVTRLQAIKTDILQHLNQADLSVTIIAARHGVSPRYVQMLFEAKGTTFSKFVLAQRLALTHCKLSDPFCAHRTISDIAFEAGFGDLSHFNRAFRRHYGATPSHIRSMACGRPCSPLSTEQSGEGGL